MQFVSFEDETAIFEAVVFPAVHRKIGDLLEEPCPCRVTGTWEDDQGARVFHLADVTAKSTTPRRTHRTADHSRGERRTRSP